MRGEAVATDGGGDVDSGDCRRLILTLILPVFNKQSFIMKIAVASPPYPKSIDEGVHWVEKLVKDAAAQQAEIICFPESYIPGYPGIEPGVVPERDAAKLQAALDSVCKIAAANKIAVILPMDWHHEGRILNVAQVISNTGQVLGYQTKNQLDPTEDELWAAGTER